MWEFREVGVILVMGLKVDIGWDLGEELFVLEGG